ncbi:MAG: hypothetical protein M1832_005084 [Thelocarpon impressellum]|nr:MAG: hypothetical protein M1832_005084 [Thelocarpon impressellum]
MPEYLVRLVQVHETFRLPELRALATLHDIPLEVLSYQTDSPFLVVRLPSDASAAALLSRSILGRAIYALLGAGPTHPALHADVRARLPTPARAPWQDSDSFRFDVDAFQNTHSAVRQLALIETFRYLGLSGTIRMKGAAEEFCVCEDWTLDAQTLRHVYLGRKLGEGDRRAVGRYDLKKRGYISTTSMPAELALLTANLALAAPEKLVYDPFLGTGSFPVACAHHGAFALGSDIDGRCVRGKGDGHDVAGNFRQYGLEGTWLDGFVADLTNSPVRAGRWLDAVVCDPPYGVREGLKVLGARSPSGRRGDVLVDGVQAYKSLPPPLSSPPLPYLPRLTRGRDGRAKGFIPPKRPFPFTALLAHILAFAAARLVDRGRLCLWMPTANDALEELPVPTHPALEVVEVGVQPFNKCASSLSSPALRYSSV